MIVALVVVTIIAVAIAVSILSAHQDNNRRASTHVLVCGATGVGKSTLINAVANRQAAETGIGVPVTQNTTRIEVKHKSLVFYDSKGLEVQDASQTYLLLLSDILRLRFCGNPRDQVDLVVICIQESQSRIDDAHLEIAGLCDDLRVPYGVSITKTFGDTRLEAYAADIFKTARFIRRVRSLPMHIPGANVEPEGIAELVGECRSAGKWDSAAARRRAAAAPKTSSLAAAARHLAHNSAVDRAWVSFAAAASELLSASPKSAFSKVLSSMRGNVRKAMVPGFFTRVVLTRFDDTRIDSACARRLIPFIFMRFADATLHLTQSDISTATSEAFESLHKERPYRSRF